MKGLRAVMVVKRDRTKNRDDDLREMEWEDGYEYVATPDKTWAHSQQDCQQSEAWEPCQLPAASAVCGGLWGNT